MEKHSQILQIFCIFLTKQLSNDSMGSMSHEYNLDENLFDKINTFLLETDKKKQKKQIISVCYFLYIGIYFDVLFNTSFFFDIF